MGVILLMYTILLDLLSLDWLRDHALGGGENQGRAGAHELPDYAACKVRV
jgi:hypothetical protein